MHVKDFNITKFNRDKYKALLLDWDNPQNLNKLGDGMGTVMQRRR